MIKKETVKNLLDQINDHSGIICQLIDEAKNAPIMNEEMVQISVHNQCIQDVLVSFFDIYMS